MEMQIVTIKSLQGDGGSLERIIIGLLALVKKILQRYLGLETIIHGEVGRQ
jgi:hypothetical protein